MSDDRFLPDWAVAEFRAPELRDALRRHNRSRMPGRDRYGDRTLLASGVIVPAGSRKRSTIIDTDIWPYPVVWAVRLRFQSALPLGNPSIREDAWGFLPVSGGVTAIVRRAVDDMAGLTDELYTVGLNFPQFHLAKKLVIDLQMADEEGGAQDFAEAIAVPICDIDGSVLGGSLAGELGGYGTTNFSRVAATTTGNTTLLASNQFRRQFFIQNNSAQTLAVKLGSGAATTAGSENWTFLLTGGSDAVYESPIGGYTGIVTGVWFAADAAGEALITEGRNP